MYLKNKLILYLSSEDNGSVICLLLNKDVFDDFN